MNTTIYDAEILIHGIDSDIEYLLTCEHSASSYGLPVAVDADGIAHGPAETDKVAFVAYTGRDYDASKALFDRAIAAGFQFGIAPETTPDPERPWEIA